MLCPAACLRPTPGRVAPFVPQAGSLVHSQLAAAGRTQRELIAADGEAGQRVTDHSPLPTVENDFTILPN